MKILSQLLSLVLAIFYLIVGFYSGGIQTMLYVFIIEIALLSAIWFPDKMTAARIPQKAIPLYAWVCLLIFPPLFLFLMEAIVTTMKK